MTDIKPVMFLYITGVLDILITIICVFNGWANETTTLYAGIQPIWLMCLTMVLANTAMCLMVAAGYYLLHEHRANHKAADIILSGLVIMIYGFGLIRLYVAGKGLVILVGSVLVW